MIDYLRLAQTAEQIEWDYAIGVLTRAWLYIEKRRPNELDALEIFQDRLDAMEGARRAKVIN